MTPTSPVRPLRADEILYRCVPVRPEFIDVASGRLRELAFKPTPQDIDGLSLSREIVGPHGTAATGPAGRTFDVASLRAGDLTDKLGLTVVPDRDDHAVIVDLTHAMRQLKDEATVDRLAATYWQLVEAVREVSGPYPGRLVLPTGTA